MKCDTFDCDQLAMRRVSWKSDGELLGGEFCDECARFLWLRGDECDPPFELAPVMALAAHRGGAQ
jgi:hypothetical protein